MRDDGPRPPEPPRGWLGLLLPVGVPNLAAARRRKRQATLVVLPIVVAIFAIVAWHEAHRSRSRRNQPRAPQPYVAPTSGGDDGLPSWALGPFIRPGVSAPVITPNLESIFDCPVRKQPVHWEVRHTFNPAAIVCNGKVVVLYRAEDDSGTGIGSFTSRLGLAESDDGIHFTRRPTPVFFPADDAQKANEWPGGCEDPRLAETEDGVYVLTYTQWNRRVWRLAVATSKDLTTWRKHGPAFASAGAKYTDMACKSGGFVCRISGDRLITARIDGKYWMYWGEGEMHLATSDDLIHWTPVEDEQGKLATVLGPRPGRFDSAFPEGGPPPVLTDKGIVVLYNGKNEGKDGDKDLAPGSYAGGQALFDAGHPAKLLARLEAPFFKPEKPFEKSGQYAAGTTFIEGLVFFKGKWFLYYGCADSTVGVAVFDPAEAARSKPR